MNHIIKHSGSTAELFNNIITKETWCSVASLEYEDAYIGPRPIHGSIYQTSCEISGNHCTIYLYKVTPSEMPIGEISSSPNHASEYLYHTVVKCNPSGQGCHISRDLFNSLSQDILGNAFGHIQQE